jgi:hypothetical protein
LNSRLIIPAELLGVVLALFRADPAAGQGLVTQDPNKVKAAYLLNFTRYVTWPTNTFAATNAPWRIGILGSDPFGEVLDNTFRGRTEQGRSFEIIRAPTLDRLPPCQVVFIAAMDAAPRQAALGVFKKQPVLTVSDASDFLEDGGIVRFQTADRVRMSVNLDQARAVSLTIQTKMLEVSNAVLENGKLQNLR